MKASRFALLLLAGLAAVAACKRSNSSSFSPSPAEAAAGATSQPAAGATASRHDPAHPPIDCPLRKQGIDPTRLKPFEQTEKYIAFLERADRAQWQKPDAVIAALGLRGDETVVDLGAGSGYFSFRFARALPRGRVVAADTEPEMVRHIHHRALTEAVANVHATVIDAARPDIPDDADLVFICDVLHHVDQREAWLASLVEQMKPGARLALVEFKEGALPEGPPESLKIPRARLLEMAQDARLRLVADHGSLLPYQVFLVFEKPT